MRTEIIISSINIENIRRSSYEKRDIPDLMCADQIVLAWLGLFILDNHLVIKRKNMNASDFKFVRNINMTP